MEYKTPKMEYKTPKMEYKTPKMEYKTPKITEKVKKERIGNQALRTWIQRKEAASAGSGEGFRTFSEIWRKSVLRGVENSRRTAGQQLNYTTRPKSGSICVSSLLNILYNFLFNRKNICTRRNNIGPITYFRNDFFSN